MKLFSRCESSQFGQLTSENWIASDHTVRFVNRLNLFVQRRTAWGQHRTGPYAPGCNPTDLFCTNMIRIASDHMHRLVCPTDLFCTNKSRIGPYVALRRRLVTRRCASCATATATVTERMGVFRNVYQGRYMASQKWRTHDRTKDLAYVNSNQVYSNAEMISMHVSKLAWIWVLTYALEVQYCETLSHRHAKRWKPTPFNKVKHLDWDVRNLHRLILSNFVVCFSQSYIPPLIFVIQNQPQVFITVRHW